MGERGSEEAAAEGEEGRQVSGRGRGQAVRGSGTGRGRVGEGEQGMASRQGGEGAAGEVEG